MAEEGLHGLLFFLHKESSPLLGEISFFILFSFSPHISSRKFSSFCFYTSSAKVAVWMLYWFLLLMPFSPGDRLTLSVRSFLLSFISEMDPPWPSLLSPCHMWKAPSAINGHYLPAWVLTEQVHLIICDTESFNVFTFPFSVPTHTMENFPCHWVHCTEPAQSIPVNLSKPFVSGGNSTGSTFEGKPDLGI